MREIQFRGLAGTVKGKKWVYGNYYKVKSFFYDNEAHFIGIIRDNHLMDFNIDKNTLGQYTGLHDKNGKEIYEGDIVKGLFKDQEEPEIIGTVIYSDYQASYIVIANNDDEWVLGYLDELEVIGNIYEDNNLLEE